MRNGFRHALPAKRQGSVGHDPRRFGRVAKIDRKTLQVVISVEAQEFLVAKARELDVSTVSELVRAALEEVFPDMPKFDSRK
jgi:hypothetical protein